VSERPIEFEKHRGMAAQKATDIRRILADVEANAKLWRDKQGVVEIQILAAPATSWPEAVPKARYVLNLYSAGLAPTDIHPPRPRGRGACGPHPARGRRDLNKPMFSRNNHPLHPVAPAMIERRKPKASDAKSHAPSRHDGRIASSRGGARLVLHQGQWNLRLRPAFFRSGLPAQDR
jgi:hypothetical protein